MAPVMLKKTLEGKIIVSKFHQLDTPWYFLQKVSLGCKYKGLKNLSSRKHTEIELTRLLGTLIALRLGKEASLRVQTQC